jgi:hypothetical protein
MIGKAVGSGALFGPAGVLAALSSASPCDKNPCLTAIEVAKKGGKVSGREKPEEKTQGSKKVPEEEKEGTRVWAKGLKSCSITMVAPASEKGGEDETGYAGYYDFSWPPCGAPLRPGGGGPRENPEC